MDTITSRLATQTFVAKNLRKWYVSANKPQPKYQQGEQFNRVKDAEITEIS